MKAHKSAESDVGLQHEGSRVMTGEVIFWLIAFVVLVVVEFASLQLLSIWFAAGAFVAMLFAAFDFPLWIQTIVFILVSSALLACTRPFLKKFLHKPPVPTNSELDVGKTAFVIESIDNLKMTGRVNINGVDWTARSTNSNFIEQGETVIIDRVDGAKLFVSIGQ